MHMLFRVFVLAVFSPSAFGGSESSLHGLEFSFGFGGKCDSLFEPRERGPAINMEVVGSSGEIDQKLISTISRKFEKMNSQIERSAKRTMNGCKLPEEESPRKNPTPRIDIEPFRIRQFSPLAKLEQGFKLGITPHAADRQNATRFVRS